VTANSFPYMFRVHFCVRVMNNGSVIVIYCSLHGISERTLTAYFLRVFTMKEVSESISTKYFRFPSYGTSKLPKLVVCFPVNGACQRSANGWRVMSVLVCCYAT